MKKLLFILVLLPLVSFAQKKETEKPKDSIKQPIQETFNFEYRYYGSKPCKPNTIELLKKLKDRNQLENPYKFTKKDTLVIKDEIFL